MPWPHLDHSQLKVRSHDCPNTCLKDDRGTSSLNERNWGKIFPQNGTPWKINMLQVHPGKLTAGSPKNYPIETGPPPFLCWSRCCVEAVDEFIHLKTGWWTKTTCFFVVRVPFSGGKHFASFFSNWSLQSLPKPSAQQFSMGVCGLNQGVSPCCILFHPEKTYQTPWVCEGYVPQILDLSGKKDSSRTWPLLRTGLTYKHLKIITCYSPASKQLCVPKSCQFLFISTDPTKTHYPGFSSSNK